MKKRKKELEVDFIGGNDPLTKEEEKKISDILNELKLKRTSYKRTTDKQVLKKRIKAKL